MCQRCYDNTMKRNAKKYELALSVKESCPEGMTLCMRCKKPKPSEEFGINPQHKRKIARGESSASQCRSCREYGAIKADEYRAGHSPEKKFLLLTEKREYSRTFRRRIIAAYGSACSCCGETQPEFLELHHVNSDGGKHRRQIGASPEALCRWAEEHGFPPSLQLICANCHNAESFYGGCPHKSFNIIYLLEKAS